MYRSHHIRGLFAAAVVLVGAAAVGLWWWHPAAKPADKGPPPVPVPVQTIRADRINFPVYLDSLGTVQPINSVLVRSRVDGPIVKMEFTEGQIVHEGDLLVQIDPRPFQAALDQAMAKKAQDEATLQNALLDLERYNQLAANNNGSRQQRDTAAATVQQLKALIQADQAAIDSAKLNVEFTSIRAPITGRASFNQLTLGNIVHATDTTGIVTIAQVQPISVVFTAPENQLTHIVQASNQRRLEAIAQSSDGTHTLARGSLAVVNNQVDTTSGTVQIKANFDNADDALWPGLSVNIRLLVDTMTNAVVIPATALERGQSGYYVFVVDDKSKANRRDVQVGPMTDHRAVITHGLAPDEQVVTDGQYRLDNDVRVTAADQTPPAQRAASEAAREAATNATAPVRSED
jgi:multidrug efflux system membrane fusion protein